MAKAKRQRKEIARENGGKENPRTRVRTSGETSSPPGQPNLHRVGSGEETKHIKTGAKIEPLCFFGLKERYKHLNAEFQRIARRDKKAFLSDQCKEIEENNRMGKTSNLFKKIKRYQRISFMQRWAQ